ncbi:MAG TPA: hypothetical protein VMV72_01405 [Verrucomicrobiae bacterium]|nr:hypothetical protein [Verrucomicrobiae bacterium]
MKAVLLTALIALAAAPLVVAGSPSAPQATTTQTNAPQPDTLGFLETRDYSIEIKAGQKRTSTHVDTVRTKDGTIVSNVTITSGETGAYTVRSKDGKILAESISASQLSAQFPSLERIVFGLAGNTDAGTNIIRGATWNDDASIGLSKPSGGTGARNRRSGD